MNEAITTTRPDGSVRVELSKDAYDRLVNLAELAEDTHIHIEAKRARQFGGEWFSSEFVNRLLAGENPVKVWREHRGMTQQELSGKAGLHQSQLAVIERDGLKSIGVARRISKALDCDIDDLVGEEEPGDEP